MAIRFPTKKTRRWLLTTLVFWGVVAGATVWEASRDARRAADRSLALEAALDSPTDLDSVALDDLLVEMEQAKAGFESAQRGLDSKVLWPLRPVPVIGRQLASARALANAGAVTVDALLPVSRLVRDAAGPSGELGRAEAATLMAAELAVAESRVSDLDFGPADNLVGPLAEARVTAVEKSTDLEERLGSARRVLEGLGEFLGGSDYLLLVANNAEMRLGAGMPLSLGQIHLGDDGLRLASMRPTHEFYPVAETALVDDDVDARWGFLSPGDDFRKLTYTARFADYIGPQALAMWEAETGDRLDGVLLIDPYVLVSLLQVTGPVSADGVTIDASNALEFFLVDQYREYGDPDLAVQTERRDRQAILAAAIFSGFTDSDWSPFDLISSLEPVARGRHLMLYSDRSTQQITWSELGVAGELIGRETGVFLLNLTASKSDPFVTVEVTMNSSVVDGRTQVELVVGLFNQTPAGISDFAAGVWSELSMEKGDYLGRLAVYAPGSATNLRFEPERSLEVFGPDGPGWVMGSRIVLPKGKRETVTVRYELPLGEDMVVLPSARYPGTQWTIDGRVLDDRVPIPIDLGGG